MKYRDTYRIVTQVSRYVSHRDFRYRATPTIHPTKYLYQMAWMYANVILLKMYCREDGHTRQRPAAGFVDAHWIR